MRISLVFDLGGVLIDWNPRHLYRKLLPSQAEMEWFLKNVCTPEWNERQDCGRPFSEGVESLVREHPEFEPLIRAYHQRWTETLGGAIAGSVEILDELRKKKTPLYALSNWSAETFGHTRQRFDFLSWFNGILISGEVGVSKPHPRIYQELIRRYSIDPHQAIFIDDHRANVEAGARVGFNSILFESPDQLRRALEKAGLLDAHSEK